MDAFPFFIIRRNLSTQMMGFTYPSLSSSPAYGLSGVCCIFWGDMVWKNLEVFLPFIVYVQSKETLVL